MVAALGGVELVEVSSPALPCPLPHLLPPLQRTSWAHLGNLDSKLLAIHANGLEQRVALERASVAVGAWPGADGVATYFAEPHNFCAQQKTFARSQ